MPSNKLFRVRGFFMRTLPLPPLSLLLFPIFNLSTHVCIWAARVYSYCIIIAVRCVRVVRVCGVCDCWTLKPHRFLHFAKWIFIEVATWRPFIKYALHSFSRHLFRTCIWLRFIDLIHLNVNVVLMLLDDAINYERIWMVLASCAFALESSLSVWTSASFESWHEIIVHAQTILNGIFIKWYRRARVPCKINNGNGMQFTREKAVGKSRCGEEMRVASKWVYCSHGTQTEHSLIHFYDMP